MKNVYFIVMLGIFSLFSNLSIAQHSYISFDSITSSGVKLVGSTTNDNAQFITLLKGKDQEIRYTPYDVSEYRLEKGTIYVSKEISTSGKKERVFLERLDKGKINLYYFPNNGKDLFFIETDSLALKEIPTEKSNYRNVLKEVTSDFEWELDQINVTRYKKHAFKELISIYNEGKSRSLPFTRFGIMFGFKSAMINISKAMTEDMLDAFEFSPSYSISLGVFADMPILSKDFSFYTGLSYSKDRYEASFGIDEFNYDIIADIGYIQLPVMLRYTMPQRRTRLFANMGGSWLHYLQNENSINETAVINNGSDSYTVTEKINRQDFVGENSFGVIFGSGLLYNLDYRRILSLEARYSCFFKDNYCAGFNQFSMVIGFSI